MIYANSVTRFRERERLGSRRAFIARGSRATRCLVCLIAQNFCCCSERPDAAGSVAVCLIYAKGEVFKPSNTGRLVADVLSDNHAFLWHRTEPDSDLLALLSNPVYAPVLIFPFDYAEPQRCLDTQERKDIWISSLEGRKPLLVLLDGTWREARKMFRSEWLSHLPVIAVQPGATAEYGLRKAAHAFQLGSAEAAANVLMQLGDKKSSQALSQYHEVFRRAYLASKPLGHGQVQGEYGTETG